MKAFNPTPAFEAEVRTLYVGGVPVHQIAKRLKAPVAVVVTTKNRLRLHRDPTQGAHVTCAMERPAGSFHHKGRVWTAQEDEELSRLHATDMPMTAIAQRFGVGPAAVNRRAIVLGLPPRRPDILTPALVAVDEFIAGATATMKASVATTTVPEVVWSATQDDRITRLFAVGVKPEEIAKDLGRGVAVVRDRIATLGLKRGSLERHPSTIVALGATPAAPKEDVFLVNREAITALTRDADGFEITAAAYGIDVDRRFKVSEVKGIDDALDRTVAALRALVVADRITAGAPCDPEDVRTALAAAQEAGRVSDAVVLAAWKAGVMTVDGRARRRPASAAKGTRAPRFRWTPEQDTQLRNLWIKGATRREISDKLGVPMTTVRDRTIKLKLPTRMWDAAAGLSRVTA